MQLMTTPTYVEAITFNDDWRGFNAGDTVEFRGGLTLLVGDQGTGKSSVIAAIEDNCGTGVGPRARHQRAAAKITFGPDAEKGISVFTFDFEKSNPRTLSYLLDGDSMRSQVQSMFMSHGQTVNGVLDDIVRQCADTKALLLLDEPDMALSPRSAHRLAQLFAELSAAEVQVVAAVHNPIVIAAAGDVYSLDDRRWVSSADYLDAATRPAPKAPAAKKTPAKRPAKATSARTRRAKTTQRRSDQGS